MPKIKTHSGLKKRLKRTGSGKLKRSHAYISHLSHNKTHKQKKHLAKATVVLQITRELNQDYLNNFS